MHENEATPYEAENEAEANNYEAENKVEAVKFVLEADPASKTTSLGSPPKMHETEVKWCNLRPYKDQFGAKSASKNHFWQIFGKLETKCLVSRITEPPETHSRPHSDCTSRYNPIITQCSVAQFD